MSAIPEENPDNPEDYEEPIDLNDNSEQTGSKQGYNPNEIQLNPNYEAPLGESLFKSRLTNANNDFRYTIIDQPLYRATIKTSNQPNEEEANQKQQDKPTGTNKQITSQLKQMKQNEDNSVRFKFRFKIILVGDIAVGKTSFIGRYISNSFSNEYKSTVGAESRRKVIQYDNNTKVELMIWDTAGEERYRAMTKNYFKDAHGAIVVFDLTNSESFEKLSHWTDFIKDCSPSNVVINLVGNKCDQIDERLVSNEEAQAFAIKNNISYFEASASDGSNVSIVFEDLTDKMVSANKEKINTDEEHEEHKKTKLLNTKKTKKKKKCCK